MQPHPYLDWEGPIPFAHRGGASDAPENTMPAFQYAVGLGYRYIETDVQVTSDGVVVAFHDDDLRRTCGVRGRISDLPWREVRQARVNGEAPIPLLEDVLGEWPDLRVNIDCKTDAAAPGLASALRRTNSLSRVMVGSFSDARLRRLRAALGPELCTSSGPAAVAHLRYGRPRRPSSHAVQVPVTYGKLPVVDATFIAKAHALGMAVHVWIIDDAQEMHRLLDLGVDGLMTDRPAILRQVFEQRGIWH